MRLFLLLVIFLVTSIINGQSREILKKNNSLLRVTYQIDEKLYLFYQYTDDNTYELVTLNTSNSKVTNSRQINTLNVNELRITKLGFWFIEQVFDDKKLVKTNNIHFVSYNGGLDKFYSNIGERKNLNSHIFNPLVYNDLDSFLYLSAQSLNKYKIYKFHVLKDTFENILELDTQIIFINRIGQKVVGFLYQKYNCQLIDLNKKTDLFKYEVPNAGIRFHRSLIKNDIHNYGITFMNQQSFCFKINQNTHKIDTFHNYYDSIFNEKLIQVGVLENKNIPYASLYKNNFRIVYHPSFGHEMAYVLNDSIRLIKDFSTGVLSSFYKFTQSSSFYFKNDTTIYVNTEYKSTKYCIKVTPTSIQALYKLDEFMDSCINFWIDNRYINQFEIIAVTDSLVYTLLSEDKNTQIFINSITPNLIAEFPSTTRNKTNTWFNEILSFSPYGDHQVSDKHISPICTKFFKDKSVFVAPFLHTNHNSSSILVHQNYSMEEKFNQNIYKFDSNGDLLWSKSFGNSPNSINSSVSVIDHEDNIIIAGVFFYQFEFDNFKKDINRAANFVLKLNGKNGELIWFKIISETIYTNDLIIDKIEIDNDNNIYVAAVSMLFNIDILNQSFFNDRTPNNLLLKVRNDGKFEWVKSISTPWLNIAGSTSVLKFNPIKNQIIAIQSQGGFSTSSTCKFMNFDNLIQTIDLNGTIVSKHQILTSDLGGITGASFNKNGEMLVHGYYRGSIYFPNKTFTTKTYRNCNKNEQFTYIYDFELNKIKSSFSSNDDAFYTFEMKSNSDYIYAIGYNENEQLEMRKYNHKGTLIGFKKFNQFQKFNFYSNYKYLSFDVTDSFIVITANNFKTDNAYSVFPLDNTVAFNSLGILKIKDLDWETPIVNNTTDIFRLLVYPNPTNNFLFIESNESLIDYKIVNMLGQTIKTNTFENDVLSRIDVNDLSSGIYFISISFKDKVETVKFIKQ